MIENETSYEVEDAKNIISALMMLMIEQEGLGLKIQYTKCGHFTIIYSYSPFISYMKYCPCHSFFDNSFS